MFEKRQNIPYSFVSLKFKLIQLVVIYEPVTFKKREKKKLKTTNLTHLLSKPKQNNKISLWQNISIKMISIRKQTGDLLTLVACSVIIRNISLIPCCLAQIMTYG